MVSNEGSEPAYGVKMDSPDFEQTIGTLNPGETKKYQSKIYIPTNSDIQKDFEPNATLSNPFFIENFSVTFNSAKHPILSNTLDINLH